jgi:hypothetical protein
MSKDERFDAIFLNLGQQLEGGVPQMLDQLFGFLRRKTDFYSGGEPGAAKKMVLTAFEKHQTLALEEKKKREIEDKKRKREEEERKKKEEEEEMKKSRVVEVTEEEAKEIQQSKETTPKVAQQESKIESKTAQELKPTSSQESKSEKAEKGGKGAEDDEGTGLIPNSGNGSQTDTYTWTQVLSELESHIKVPNGVKAKDLDIQIKTSKLKLGLKGKKAIVEGEWYKPIKPDDSYWTFEDGTVVLHLVKQNQMEWWSCLLKGEPEINTRKIVPENSRLEDLDPETRQTVEKMMIEQRQKQAGLPTPDEMQKQEILRQFKEKHPEMDFSKAKIS